MTWLRWNITSSEFQPISNGDTIYVPLSDHVVAMMVMIFAIGLMLLFFFEGLSMTRRLDRYRLKYGFDREIEKKEISEKDTEFKLDKREERFKRRVFKD